MTDSEKDKYYKIETEKNLDINNLQSNLLQQHWAPFSNLSGARQFLWLDSTKSWLHSGSTRKNFMWLWLEELVTLTRQKWLGHITEANPGRLRCAPFNSRTEKQHDHWTLYGYGRPAASMSSPHSKMQASWPFILQQNCQRNSAILEGPCTETQSSSSARAWTKREDEKVWSW